MSRPKGEIIIQPGANVWDHEIATAKALAAAGYNVTFIKASTIPHEKSPDILMNGLFWEIKAPEGSLMKRVEKNIRRALAQSCNVVFDCRRMKGLPDTAIERELRICAETRIKKLEHLIFINRKGVVIDIK